MKRPDFTNSNYVDMEFEFYYCYLKARRHKRSTTDEMKFEVYEMKNIIDLIMSIELRKYRPGRSIAFIIFDPVIREIFAAPFRDRIVHHFLYECCAPWWERRFIEDSYSCRKGKGTLYGIQRLYEHMRVVTNDFTKEGYVIKMDIEGYFTSLVRKRLYERIVWGLDKQFPNKGKRYELLRYLWREVIFDDPTDGVRLRGSSRDWAKLPDRKSLLRQPSGRGVVIGNLTSQLLSNIYLDQLDRYVKFVLGYRHYGRYVDDFYIVVKKEQLKKAIDDIAAIRIFLRTLGLKLHRRKLYIQPIRHGVGFLGVVLYPHHIVPSKRLKKNFRMVARRYAQIQNSDAVILSYLGAMTHMNSKNFAHKVFLENGWVHRF